MRFGAGVLCSFSGCSWSHSLSAGQVSSGTETSYRTSKEAEEVGTSVVLTHTGATAGIPALNLRITFTPPYHPTVFWEGHFCGARMLRSWVIGLTWEMT